MLEVIVLLKSKKYKYVTFSKAIEDFCINVTSTEKSMQMKSV